MTETLTQSARPGAGHDVLPDVRLELRRGSGKGSFYSLAEVDFLIGTVPGCDLRVPGTDLPAVLCLIARSPYGVRFRKLAHTQTILVNGQSVASATLSDGDRITVGATDIIVHVQAGLPFLTQDLSEESGDFRTDVERFQHERALWSQQQRDQLRALEDRAAQLQERHDQLETKARELEADRVAWYQRREELERELAAKGEAGEDHDLDTAWKDLEQREHALAERARETAEREQSATAKTAQLDQQKQELAAARQELSDIRSQLYDKYHERRDRLAGLREAVNRAAHKVQEEKQRLQADKQDVDALRRELEALRSELAERETAAAVQAQRLEEERQQWIAGKSDLQQEFDARVADIEAREKKLADDGQEFGKRQTQLHDDLLRLERRQAALEQREQQVLANELEVVAKIEQLHKDSGELEEQVQNSAGWRTELQKEAQRVEQLKTEHEATANQLAQRAAALEGQQATLAALRTRLERVREEVRREEQTLAEQRVRQEQTEAELQQQLQEALRLRGELDQEQKLHEQERQQLTERSAVLEAAVLQLRQAQEKLAADEERVREKEEDLHQRIAGQEDHEATMQGRLSQLEETQERLEAERQALRERTQALTQAEQVRETLQEQLRRRSDELANRQRALADQFQECKDQAAAVEARRAELEQEHQRGLEQLAAQRADWEAQQAALEQQRAELHGRETALAENIEKLKETGRHVSSQRKVLAEERQQARTEQQEMQVAQAARRAELEDLRRSAKELAQQLPDAELRVGTALERMTGAREQLREHLEEVHAYVRQCRDDLEVLHGQVRAEAERLQQHEQQVHRQQDEHRLAVAAFRQQLIDWQGQLADKKRVLTQDATRLEWRQAEVAEQARQIDATHQTLARRAHDIDQQEKVVAGKHREMDRHLDEMSQWYRKKLRDLAGIQAPPPQRAPAPHRVSPPHGEAAGPGQRAAAVSDVDDTPSVEDATGEPVVPAQRRNILSLTGPVDAADQRLGDALEALAFIDPDTLMALLVEARRQRRSLRHVLLASSVVTLYQLALIEAGNIDALMLGPVRVIDRLGVTAHETLYRVFDPRRGQEALLRHLAEGDAADVAHAEEFRHSFRRAHIEHPHVADSYEVLDITGRPAVLQEWLSGVPCSDWPPLASVPGVCFRLLSQAALGLATMHDRGLVHGHLHDQSLLLTGEGILKICGAGEPSWLASPPFTGSPILADDLRALGHIVQGWCSPQAVRKGAKVKPMPAEFEQVLARLRGADGTEPFTSAAALLEDLDRISAQIPANQEAWDRLVRHVKEHAAPPAALRQSA